MKTLQKRIDFLQNKVASKDAIIKMLLERQNRNLDSGTNCTSQNRDKKNFHENYRRFVHSN